MLTKSMREFVENRENLHKNVYFSRLRRTCKDTFEDLVLCLERLPEEQQAKIFTEEELRPFFKALFTLGTPPKARGALSKKEHERKQELMAARRERLIHILNQLLHIMEQAGQNLLPDTSQILMLGAAFDHPGLTALTLAGMVKEGKMSKIRKG